VSLGVAFFVVDHGTAENVESQVKVGLLKGEYHIMVMVSKMDSAVEFRKKKAARNVHNATKKRKLTKANQEKKRETKL